jgi:hypothetical protein
MQQVRMQRCHVKSAVCSGLYTGVYHDRSGNSLYLPNPWLLCGCWVGCWVWALHVCSAKSNRCNAPSTSRATWADCAADRRGSTSGGQQLGGCTTSCAAHSTAQHSTNNSTAQTAQHSANNSTGHHQGFKF